MTHEVEYTGGLLAAMSSVRHSSLLPPVQALEDSPCCQHRAAVMVEVVLRLLQNRAGLQVRAGGGRLVPRVVA